MQKLSPFILGAVAASALAQQQAPQPGFGGLDARQLYYFSAPKKEEPLPAIPEKPKRTAGRGTTPARPATPPPAATVHLGLRYTVGLVHEERQGDARFEPVNPARSFRKGDCFAIKVSANRDSYLYVLSRQSSGIWQPLLPTPHMPDEKNVLAADAKVMIPATHCFEITDPPGTEVLSIILSRDPRDVLDLHDTIQNAPDDDQAAKRITNEVDRVTQMGSRDIAFRTIEKPQAASEDAYSNFVVNRADKPSALLVATIRLEHK
jgi:hypothetical protein